jgi:predicted tellurium resistance membrane protein TerC
MLEILTMKNLVALATLTGLEIVLGIDNIVVITILAERVRPDLQSRARRVGLALAMLLRIGLLISISWVMGLTAPLFALVGHPLSGRDLLLLVGGMFLIGKATFEIHETIEGAGRVRPPVRLRASFAGVIAQILALDLVFSLDSVVTAVGLVDVLWVMISAILVAMGVMIVFIDMVAVLVARHPTIKMLALSFLLLIGVVLMAEGLGRHVDKGYLYFAMGFSLLVEILNLQVRGRRRAAAEARAV